jgi:hypothetical protein
MFAMTGETARDDGLAVSHIVLLDIISFVLMILTRQNSNRTKTNYVLSLNREEKLFASTFGDRLTISGAVDPPAGGVSAVVG